MLKHYRSRHVGVSLFFIFTFGIVYHVAPYRWKAGSDMYDRFYFNFVCLNRRLRRLRMSFGEKYI